MTMDRKINTDFFFVKIHSMRSIRILSFFFYFTLHYSLFGIHYSFAQTEKTDSLTARLTKSLHDTDRVKSLNALFSEHISSKPEKALEYAQRALELAENTKWKKGIAATLGNVGLVYWNQGDYPKALEYYFRALKIDKELGNKNGIAGHLGNIGIVYWNQGDYPKALNYYFRTLKIGEELGDKKRIAIQLGNIGLVYDEQGNNPKALDYYFRALKINEELGNKNGIAICLGNIGIVYHEQGDYPKALDYYFKAFNMDEELGNKNGIARHLGNIGIVYRNQGDYPKALEYYFKVLKMAEELGNKNSISAILGNIGLLYTKTGNFQKAESYLESALIVSDSIGALFYQKNHHEALTRLYDTTAHIAYRSSNYKSAALLYKSALTHNRKAGMAKDTLFNEEKSKEIGGLEQKHIFEMSAMKKRQAETEKNRQVAVAVSRRNLLQHSGIMLGLLLLGSVLFLLARFHIPLWLLEGIVFFFFLLTFEFILVLLNPYIEKWSGGAPVWNLLFNSLIAVVIFPLHRYFEGVLKRRILKTSPVEREKGRKGEREKGRMGEWENEKTGNQPPATNIVFIFLLTTLVFINSGFDNKVDSLKVELQKDLHDSTQVNTLHALFNQYISISPDTALHYAQQALSLAEKIKWEKGTSNSFHAIGHYYYTQGDYSNALTYWLKVLNAREALNDNNGIAASLGNIGVVYQEQGNFSKALDYYFRALKINEELGNKNSIAIRLGNIGVVYMEQGDYPKALDYYFRALKMDDELGNKNSIAIRLGNIGLVYYYQTDYSKALEYYFRALKMKEVLGNKSEIAITLGNIGIVYKEQGDNPKALEYYFRALKMDQELGNKDGIARHLGNIGSLYIKTGKFQKAESYLDNALSVSDSIGALLYQKDHHEMFTQLHDTTAHLAFQAGNYKEAARRYESALTHNKKAGTAKDTLFNEEKSKEIGGLEQKHIFEMETLKKEQAEAEKSRQEAVAVSRRNLLQNSGIMLGLLLLGSALLLLARFHIPLWLLEGIVFFFFLLSFEFILVLINPYIDAWSGGAPVWNLLFNSLIAVVIFPLHRYFEGVLKRRILKTVNI
ncbi:MAG: hypothetical protein A3H98_02265 [Bacteroidetes bacterium RIFCSPLOWO2_02_FULL_36_8]|nr:MAG: hypothetical protein A3H98_02265 [Bacteroidetes bacterium RIFCSPLOWO2_02_FULL_36_8]